MPVVMNFKFQIVPIISWKICRGWLMQTMFQQRYPRLVFHSFFCCYCNVFYFLLVYYKPFFSIWAMCIKCSKYDKIVDHVLLITILMIIYCFIHHKSDQQLPLFAVLSLFLSMIQFNFLVVASIFILSIVMLQKLPDM